MDKLSFEVKTHSSQFDHIALFNMVSLMAIDSHSSQQQRTDTGDTNSLSNVLQGARGVQNALRLLNVCSRKIESKDALSRRIYFCRSTINQKTNGKTFFLRMLMKDSKVTRDQPIIQLKLDMPSKVLVFKRDLLVAIERKCLTLYQIDDDIVRLKDYDLTQIGGKFSCIDLVYVSYCGCDYLLTFGNEKEFEKTQFKCIVFEIKDLCLCFVKKVVIANQEVYRPVILFENYAGCNSTDMYCLVIGGYSDSVFHTYICSAFQINLHLLLSKWFEYPSSQTVCVEFKSFQFPITAGKAIKIGKKWYVFSTQDQTISQLTLEADQKNCSALSSIEVRTENFRIQENIYFSENTFQIDSQKQVYWCDSCLNIKPRQFEPRDLTPYLNKFSESQNSNK